jgi:signal transduction histidine kinase
VQDVRAASAKRTGRLRFLASAGIPAAVALVALIAVLFWRISILHDASAREDQADQLVVAAAGLRTDLMRLQSDERAVLLTGEARGSERPRLRDVATKRFEQLRGLVSDPDQIAELTSMRHEYGAWLQSSSLLLQGRLRHPAPRLFTGSDLRLVLTTALNGRAEGFVQLQRRNRLTASKATDDAARAAVFTTIAGMVIVAAILLYSVLRAMVDSHRETRRLWDEAQALEKAQARGVELEDRNREIQETSRVKSQFVAHMSHELRTPLTAILGLGEMLYDEKAGPLSDRQKAYTSDILSSGHHLLDLINEVLDLAKAEAGKITMIFRECDPRDVAFEVSETMRSLATVGGLSLKTDFANAPDRVVTDVARLRQILYNYLSNAIKFTKPGGTITLRIVREPNDCYRLEVTDTGIGIAETDMGQLFVDFSQIQPSQGGGAGLGLALTKRLVEALGGTVGAASRWGVGSVFFAILPCQPLISPKGGLRS